MPPIQCAAAGSGGVLPQRHALPAARLRKGDGRPAPGGPKRSPVARMSGVARMPVARSPAARMSGGRGTTCFCSEAPARRGEPAGAGAGRLTGPAGQDRVDAHFREGQVSAQYPDGACAPVVTLSEDSERSEWARDTGTRGRDTVAGAAGPVAVLGGMREREGRGEREGEEEGVCFWGRRGACTRASIASLAPLEAAAREHRRYPRVKDRSALNRPRPALQPPTVPTRPGRGP